MPLWGFYSKIRIHISKQVNSRQIRTSSVKYRDVMRIGT